MSLVSGVMLILTASGVIDVEKAHHINVYVDIILTILMSLGVVSDPESHVKEETT